MIDLPAGGKLCMSHRTAAFCLIVVLSSHGLAFSSGLGSGQPGRRETGNQRIRAQFNQGCQRVQAFGVVTRNAPPAPPTTGGIISVSTEIVADSIHWAGLYWQILADEEPQCWVTETKEAPWRESALQPEYTGCRLVEMCGASLLWSRPASG
jgi:hypothetical protein